MPEAARGPYDQQVLVDHTSPLGARVSAVRGSLVNSIFAVLKETGGYEDTVKALPPAEREALVGALAASWVPAQTVMALFDVCEALLASDADVARLGEVLGARITRSLFAVVVRSLGSLGSDGALWLSLEQADRLWGRLYHGGGLLIVKTGPKDVHHEVHGLPFAHSRYFRAAHMAFMRGMVTTMTKSCVVKPARTRIAHPDRFAISLSWV